MVSQKNSKSFGIIHRIRKTLGIKSKRLNYHCLIHPYMTDCVTSGRLHIELILKCFVLQERDPCVHYLRPLNNRIRFILKSKNSHS